MGETLCNGTNSLPLKEASFRLVKRFIIRTNSTTADYIKLTPFEEGTDFFSLETAPLYPIVCDSKSEGAGETGGLKKNPKAIGRSVKYIVFFLELFFFFCGEL